MERWTRGIGLFSNLLFAYSMADLVLRPSGHLWKMKPSLVEPPPPSMQRSNYARSNIFAGACLSGTVELAHILSGRSLQANPPGCL